MSSFGGTVKLTGESEYRKALKEITGNLKLLNSEMKTVTSQYDKNDKSVENLSSQNEVLNKKIEEQEKKVSLLKDALAKSKEETGESSDKTKKWQIELNNAQAELNKLNRDVEANENAMKEASAETKSEADAIKDFGDEAEKSGKSALSLGDVIKANLISEAVIGGIKALANGIMSVGSSMKDALANGTAYADNILTLSAQTGLSTDTLEKYNAVAELTDVSMETLTGSMAKNIKAMSEAQNGGKKYSEAYKELGVKVTDANGKLRDSEAVYWETVDALKGIENETERDALAMQLFGKKAQDLNTIIEMGSEGVKEYTDKAVEMGAVLGGKGLEALGNLDDQMQTFKSTTGSTGNILASAFAPALSGAMEGVNGLMGSMNGLIASVISGDEGGIENAMNLVSEQVTLMIDNISSMMPQMVTVASDLISTLLDVIAQNLPVILREGANMLSSLLSGISQNIGSVMTTVLSVVQVAIDTILKNLPTIIQMGTQMLVSLVQGISQTIPNLIPTMVDAVLLIVETCVDNIDLLVDTGIELLLAITEGIIDATPKLIEKIPVIIEKLVMAITNNLPKIIEMGVKLVVQLGSGLIKAIPQLISKIPQIIASIIKGFNNGISQMGTVGLNLVQGLWNGINNAKEWVLSKIRGFGQSVLNGIKDFFGIRSPSRKTAELGKFMGEGIAVGFTESENKMLETIDKECKAVEKTLLKSVKSGNFEKSGKTAIDNFTSAIKDKEKDLTETVTKTVNSTVEQMTKANEKNKAKYEELGKNIIDSFSEGIAKETEKAVSLVNETVTQLTQTAQKKLDEVTSMQNDLQKKMYGFGDLFTVDSSTGEVALGNIKKQNKALKEYAKDLELLKGLVSEDLINEITSLSAEEGSLVAEKLLSMSDADLKAYNDAYVKKVKLSNSLSKKFYSDKVSEIKTEFTNNVNKEMKALTDKMKSIGEDAVKGFTKGLTSKNKDLEKSLKSFSDSIVKQIKKEFKIHSPSKLMEEEIGTNLALGVGEGFTQTMKDVSNDMSNAIPTEFDTNIGSKIKGVSGSSSFFNFDVLVLAFKQALAEVKVVMNDREMGTFVTDTVERCVFA